MKKNLLFAIISFIYVNAQDYSHVNTIRAWNGSITCKNTVQKLIQSSTVLKSKCKSDLGYIEVDLVSKEIFGKLYTWITRPVQIEQEDLNWVTAMWLAADSLDIPAVKTLIASQVVESPKLLPLFIINYPNFFDSLPKDKEPLQVTHIPGNYSRQNTTISRNSRFIVSCDTVSRKLVICDTQRNAYKYVYGDFVDQPIVISNDSRLIITCDKARNGNIVVIDADSGNIIHQIAGNFIGQDIAITADSRFIVSCDANRNNNLVIFDINNGIIKHQILGDFLFQPIVINSDFNFIICCDKSRNNNLMIIDVMSGIAKYQIIGNYLNQTIAVSSNYVMVAFDKEGKNLVTINRSFQRSEHPINCSMQDIVLGSNFIASVDENGNYIHTIGDINRPGIFGNFCLQKIALSLDSRFIVSFDINKQKLVVGDYVNWNMALEIPGNYYLHNLLVGPNFIITINRDDDSLVLVNLFNKTLGRLCPGSYASVVGNSELQFVVAVDKNANNLTIINNINTISPDIVTKIKNTIVNNYFTNEIRQSLIKELTSKPDLYKHIFRSTNYEEIVNYLN